MQIRNLAVVASLNLKLEQGLTVLTGETGAGKSILLTALGLALGDRADIGFIRPQCKRAEISLEFDIQNSSMAQKWLQDNELDEQNQCLIRRVINQDGRSKAFINNRPATLQSLQNLGTVLVEIHGQHAHLTLLKNSAQRELLDEFCNHASLVDKVNTLYSDWQKTRDELQILTHEAERQIEKKELLQYQIQELEQLEIESLNFAALVEEHTLQANLGNIVTTGQNQLEQIYENEHDSINLLLGQSITALSQLSQLNNEFEEIAELLTSAQIQVQESGQVLRRLLENLESDPQRLNWLEDQLAINYDLARKHQVKPEFLPEHLDHLRNELHSIKHSSEKIESLNISLKRLAADYHSAATQLSKQRQKGALNLQDDISRIINELGMPQGEFKITTDTANGKSPKPCGLDQIEFLVSANPGLPPRPIGKIASGGELSRISLAIQVATTHKKTTPTMIFDEIDVGIGGGVAEIVGARLHTLGEGRQVLCVTHLPQVAAQSDQHLLVKKVSDLESTESQVVKLSHQERRGEIARMLGGVKITEQTLSHAEEMLGWTVKN